MRNRPLNPALRPSPDYGAAYHQRATHIPQMQTSPKRLSDHDCNEAPGSGKSRAAATPQGPRRALRSGGVGRAALVEMMTAPVSLSASTKPG